MDPPICPNHQIPLKMGFKGVPYLFCKYADPTDPTCPEMTLEAWRKKQSDQGLAELQKFADTHAPSIPVNSPDTPTTPSSSEPVQQGDPSGRGTLATSPRMRSRSQGGLSMAAGGPTNFPLPLTPEELTDDPRTGLELIDLPQEYRKQLTLFRGDALLHYVGVVSKMNHNHAYADRFLVITTYCIYILHLNGFLARCLEIVDIDRIILADRGDSDIMAMIVPSEFDLVIKSPEQGKIRNIIDTIFKFKKNRSIPVEMLTEGQILQEINLKKGSRWRLEMKYVHSKVQLYRRLQQHNEGDAALPYLTMDQDPRTGLLLLTIPKKQQHTFLGGPFASDLEPLLHFYSKCEKVNHKRGQESRFCLVTNSCVYLAYSNGRLNRCIRVAEIGEIARDGKTVVLKVPQEFDMMLIFEDEATVLELCDTLTTIYHFKTGNTLAVEAGADLTACQLKKPSKGWRSTMPHVFTRKELVEHLQALGIHPNDRPGSVGDNLDPL
eukprot:NODE_811_length_1890_cov_46.232482_g746_i0.p1 GENE.NODE_811_length_1890_cov_46.232482_g746_i0~~NODE_811_length_1890_cov_46.232482_g746_i0.p1  ORF type:complete len:493 (-),score=84.97 NODE_811_length_1890_cov_46.232482_g746_i0:251-1729(-)